MPQQYCENCAYGICEIGRCNHGTLCRIFGIRGLVMDHLGQTVWYNESGWDGSMPYQESARSQRQNRCTPRLHTQSIPLHHVNAWPTGKVGVEGPSVYAVCWWPCPVRGLSCRSWNSFGRPLAGSEGLMNNRAKPEYMAFQACTTQVRFILALHGATGFTSHLAECALEVSLSPRRSH